jgi:hypothetical protein
MYDANYVLAFAYVVWNFVFPFMKLAISTILLSNGVVKYASAMTWLGKRKYWCTQYKKNYRGDYGPSSDCTVFSWHPTYGPVMLKVHSVGLNEDQPANVHIMIFGRLGNELMKEIDIADGIRIGELGQQAGRFGVPSFVLHPYRHVDTMINKTMARKILGRLDTFARVSGQYEKLGRNHHTGILLLGDPGLGKSSMVKVIASHMKMDVIFINIQNIFHFSSILSENCIYLFEDIETQLKEISRQARRMLNGDEPPKLNISKILQILDGLKTPNNSIFIMTANTLDAVDERLLRPGRIDHTFNFVKPTREEYATFIADKYSVKKCPTSLLDWADGKNPTVVQLAVANNPNLADLLAECTKKTM